MIKRVNLPQMAAGKHFKDLTDLPRKSLHCLRHAAKILVNGTKGRFKRCSRHFDEKLQLLFCFVHCTVFDVENNFGIKNGMH